MSNGEMNINVVSFVNDSRRKDQPILQPIMAKMVLFTCMITLAMILIYSDQKWAGYVIYGKEVFEFILFICYVVKRRKHGKVQH